jgi:hypothetical protein
MRQTKKQANMYSKLLKRIPLESKFIAMLVSGVSIAGISVGGRKLLQDPDVRFTKKEQ